MEASSWRLGSWNWEAMMILARYVVVGIIGGPAVMD